MLKPTRTIGPIGGENVAGSGARLRVLIPTSRHVYELVSYGMVVDFEDNVATLSDADLVAVPLYSRRERLRGLVQRRALRPVSAPGSRYDVCLLVAMAPDWIPGLRYVRNLRSVADRVVVYLFDSWLTDLPAVSAYRGVWQLVDDLFVSFDHAAASYAERLPCRVHYLPQAIDPRWFHPYRRSRPIDVLSIGRRLPVVHHNVLELSRRRDLFYYYQTHLAPRAIDFMENQELLGRLCQSARVHISWPVDRTDARRGGEGSAITARWFEAAASAAVVMGSAPRSDEFARLFPYSGFVHELTDTTLSRTEEVLDAALRDPRAKARLTLADHVRTAHTWGARWQEILSVGAR